MLAFADDTFRGSLPGIDSSLSLKFPPGLWSEDVHSFPFSPGSTTQSDFLDLSESLSSLDARSSSELVAADLPSSSPSSGSYASALDQQSTADVDNCSLAALTFLGTLGRGGYGKVLLAQSSHFGNCSLQVAVKVLAKKRMTEDDVREVKMEVQLLRALSKGEAVGTAFLQKMHAAFQTKEHVFIIMVRHTTKLVGAINLTICASFRNDTAQPCQTLPFSISSVCIPLVARRLLVSGPFRTRSRYRRLSQRPWHVVTPSVPSVFSPPNYFWVCPSYTHRASSTKISNLPTSLSLGTATL